MTKLKKRLLFVVLGALMIIGIALTIGFTSSTAYAAEAEKQPFELLAATQTDCEHEYFLQDFPATCTQQGYTLYTCTLCGETKKDDYIKALGHNYKEQPIAATCTTKGYTRYTCLTCGDQYEVTTSAELGHKFVEIVVPANCTHKGYTTHFCTTCGYEYSDKYEDETGHVYEDETRLYKTYLFCLRIFV